MSLNGPVAARLYDEHVDAIYTYAARRVGPAAAVTVVEEVFEHALRRNAERPPQTSSDLGWLLAMATAFLRRHSEVECRRLQAWEPVQRETSRAIPSVSDPLLSSDTVDPTVAITTEVMAAVADLDPVERDVLFLVAWEGCSSALTATATGLPQNEIRPTLARIRKQIRSAVTDTKPATTAPPDPAPAQPTPVDSAPDPEPDPASAQPTPVDLDAEAWVDAEVDAKTASASPSASADPDATDPLSRSDDPLDAFINARDEDGS